MQYNAGIYLETKLYLSLIHIFGYVKRQKMDTYKTQNRGGRGITGMTTRDEDVPTEMFVINSHDYVMFFTNLGRVYRLKCYEVLHNQNWSL